ncbi:hypothetical protein M406DRAFT_237415, partial [Cryphonectria parasitica EP155]
GKACTNCARVKCKCILRADGNDCERCHRLGKVCKLSAPMKQRGPKRGAASRSARLEEKLDDLVALLRAGNLPMAPTQRDHAVRTSVNSDDRVDSPSISLVSTPSSTDDHEDYSEDDASPSQADESLARFRDEMITFTPFIYIDPGIRAVNVRRTYPFLWLNIMGVTSKAVKTRNSLSLRIRRIIIEKVVAGGERSLDLLFGLLTFVNWLVRVHLFPMDKQFASLASQLAVSLIWDMGLQMPPPEHLAHFSLDVNTQSSRRERTMEEKRAVLGAFIITSVLSQTFKSADGFRWSPYLDEYLDHLTKYSTVPQDAVLVRQVKMQLIVTQCRYSSWKIRNLEIPTGWVQSLQLQLDEIADPANQTKLSATTQIGLYHYTTLTIREWVMAKSPSPSHEPDLGRYEMCQRCVHSVKAWLDIFFAMPLHMYASVPYSTYSQLCYVVRFLHHMTTTRDASWSPAAAQEALDPLDTLDRVIHTFETVAAAFATECPGNVEDQGLSLSIKKFKALKASWEAELAS